MVNMTSNTVTYSDGGNATADGFSTNPADSRDCSLTIASADNTHLDSQWSCAINQDLDNAPYRKGTFQLLTEGYLTEGMRLPLYLVPSEYEVEVVPILDSSSFITNGKVVMHFDFDEVAAEGMDTSRVVVHSKYMHIEEGNVTLTDKNDNKLKIVGHEYDLEREFYVMQVDSELDSNGSPYQLSIVYEAELLDDLRGLYYSTYEEDSAVSYLAVTQFEAVDARRAFPCMDEPDLKANFTIKIGRQSNMVAASNMPVQGSEEMADMPGYIMDTFEKTPPMSTYLAVMLIAEFNQTVSQSNASHVPFTIWHQPSKDGQASLAADAGPFILNEYENYFGIDFPLPKMDMAAIPDFDAGAMENWGLVTYRESKLLFQEGESSVGDYESIIRVIAHELAHMWFGDLVTMAWWEDLWLNEGINDTTT